MCVEHYQYLNAKVYTLMVEALTWKPTCLSMVKMDADGFLCMNRLMNMRSKIKRDLFHDSTVLPRVYAGHIHRALPLVWSEGHKWRHPDWRNPAIEVGNLQWASTPYAMGAAYIIGRKVMEFIVRHPLRELLNITWEDASVGIWSNAMRERITIDTYDTAQRGSAECSESNTYPVGVVIHRCGKRMAEGRHICGSMTGVFSFRSHFRGEKDETLKG
mmetsp:Transcript_7935/g.21721  ORF Transcript_7935/g.21721 Transcript_7935/m.21721 type:complete len:216 (+) Transcript_7935:272-919(+)